MQHHRARRFGMGVERIHEPCARRRAERLDERRHQRIERNQAALELADALGGFLQVLYVKPPSAEKKARQSRAFVAGCQALPDTLGS
jgi:hypothetical protein